MYPPHTRSCSTETWIGASQRTLGRPLLPSAASSSLSSLLDVNKCLPPTGSHRLLPLVARFKGMWPIGSPKLPTSGLGYLLVYTWQLPPALLYYAGPFQIVFACVPLTHDLHSYDLIHPNIFPQVVQPIKLVGLYSRGGQNFPKTMEFWNSTIVCSFFAVHVRAFKSVVAELVSEQLPQLPWNTDVLGGQLWLSNGSVSTSAMNTRILVPISGKYGL